jgi:hypothetical protein
MPQPQHMALLRCVDTADGGLDVQRKAAPPTGKLHTVSGHPNVVVSPLIVKADTRGDGAAGQVTF